MVSVVLASSSTASSSSRFCALLRAPARVALVVLAGALPFEMMRPLGRLGPLELSSVELFLYLAVALGGLVVAADVVARRFVLPWRWLARRHAGPIAWGAALLVTAALAAPGERAEAIKFALRSLGGIALYAVAAQVLRAPGAALWVADGIAAGALAAAGLMWGEIYLPRVAAGLVPFHPATFDVFGTPRASGPFQFSNIAAMYLEAVLPVMVAVGAAADAHRRAGVEGRRPPLYFTVAALSATAFLGGAIVLTASRAGLVTMAAIMAGLAVAAWRGALISRRQLVGAGVALSLLVGAGAVSISGLRLRFWRDADWYRSAIAAAPGAALPTAMRAGEEIAIPLEVRNVGARVWPARGQQPVMLSYHWADPASGRMVIRDGARTRLPRDVGSGENVGVLARVVAPSDPGRYRLQLGMVHEHVTWFSREGDPLTEVTVDVVDEAVPAGALAMAPGLATARAAARATDDARDDSGNLTSRAPSGRGELWRAALLAFRAHPLFGIGPDNFRHQYGRYVGRARFDVRLHANNLYLETLANEGLCGVAALALLIVGFARTARRALRRNPSDRPAGLLALGATAAMAAYPIHGLLDYFLEFTPTYGLLWLLGGMLVALGEEQTA